jgi:hypothetical protein
MVKRSQPQHKRNEGEDLHDIVVDRTGFWGPRWVAAEIQLFADRKMPKYLVIAGDRL